MKEVQKRERFLIEVYNEYQPARDAFSAKKYNRKNRASRLLKQLRAFYGEKINWANNFDFGNATAADITGNGKYSLD